MATPAAGSLADIGHTTADDFNTALTRLERRDWWLWGLAVLTLMLLFVAIAVLAIEIEPRVDLLSQEQLEIAVRCLFGLLVVFSAFVVYQQLLIKRLRQHLASEISKLVLTKSGERGE
jgi:uncharacterized membrane protein YhaH (DUF805 family)